MLLGPFVVEADDIVGLRVKRDDVVHDDDEEDERCEKTSRGRNFREESGMFSRGLGHIARLREAREGKSP